MNTVALGVLIVFAQILSTNGKITMKSASGSVIGVDPNEYGNMYVVLWKKGITRFQDAAQQWFNEKKPEMSKNTKDTTIHNLNVNDIKLRIDVPTSYKGTAILIDLLFKFYIKFERKTAGTWWNIKTAVEFSVNLVRGFSISGTNLAGIPMEGCGTSESTWNVETGSILVSKEKVKKELRGTVCDKIDGPARSFLKKLLNLLPPEIPLSFGKLMLSPPKFGDVPGNDWALIYGYDAKVIAKNGNEIQLPRGNGLTVTNRDRMISMCFPSNEELKKAVKVIESQLHKLPGIQMSNVKTDTNDNTICIHADIEVKFG